MQRKAHKRNQPKAAEKRKEDVPIKPEEKKHSGAMRYLLPSLAILITWFALSPSLDCGFTNWDDPRYVLENPLLKEANVKRIFETKEVSLNYHPLTILSLAYDYKSGGITDAKPYHRTNLIFHCLNVLLVFIIIHHLSKGNIWVAFFTALIFGVHPMHIESVTWIAERKDVLYVFFLLAAWLLYLRYAAKPSVLLYSGVLILYTASLLSKGMAVVLPVLFLLSDYFLNRKMNVRAWIEKVPLLVLSFYFGWKAIQIQSQGAIADFAVFTFFERMVFASYGAVMYLVKFIVPFKLSAFYPYPSYSSGVALPVFYYLCPFILLALFAILLYFRKNKLLVFSLFFYFVSVALVLQFISVGRAIMADRYTYLAYIGPAFLLSSALLPADTSTQKRIWFGIMLLASFSIAMAWQAHERTGVWKNSETLWTNVINNYPTVDVAYKNRGNYYGQNGDPDRAMKDYESMLKLNSGDAGVYINIGNVYSMKGRNEDAVKMYSKTLEMEPNNMQALVNRANVLGTLKRTDEALRDFEKILQLNPQQPDVHYNRAIALLNGGKLNEAILDFSSAIEENQGNVFAIMSRGVAYYQLNEFEKALMDFDRAILIAPQNGEAWFKKAVALFRLNRMEEAKAAGTQSLSLGYDIPKDIRLKLGV